MGYGVARILVVVLAARSVTARDRLKRIGPLRTAVRIARALATPLGRGRLRARLGGARLFQPATVTRMDRHPALFAAVAAALAHRSAPRLLSFGCSTGEEALTLARLLPHAQVDAIDANPACIRHARQAAHRCGAAQVRFACADRPDAFATDPYDAVLCLSVLRHGDLEADRPERCTALMPFARFAAAIDALDRCVRPGGLLVLWGCQFRFADTPTAARYAALAVPDTEPQPGPYYGTDDHLLRGATETRFVFVKRG